MHKGTVGKLYILLKTMGNYQKQEKMIILDSYDDASVNVMSKQITLLGSTIFVCSSYRRSMLN